MNFSRLLLMHALSPLHAGTGQGVGVIDLPIAREKATGLPYVPGSSVKGVLREACMADDKGRHHVSQVFGPESEQASDHAGTLHISDQRLLLLPVRSFAGTFAWTTSPYGLARFARDLTAVGGALPGFIPSLPANSDQAWTTEATKLCAQEKTVILEDLDLVAQPQAAVNAWADWLGRALFPESADWQAWLRERLCVVGDDVFNFLAETATETTARIRLDDETKTVAEGALWYEEALPAESVLYGLAVAVPVKKAELEADFIFTLLARLLEKPLQFGGKASVGRGLCQVRVADGGATL
ncbi:MAG: type III-B CRISPR module RAMP protein Cmr4 [Chloracidobacterium sp.]|uniref:Type III-B CRISPR module RAMP protein Cmr4 n=1 Tax=Chloracidobacterium validum TaxID=2821543 RepID=A0ABX8BAT5_9BACT|nr:type III-B CRISPR module RAMP protein Cmr4 [Chloracidobacterium validum]QUW04047.1 type III-B CRISPR module RAMP protein Cmr4 [Chloracidobacterium validum]